MTGVNALIKIGTKHAALVRSPVRVLSDFGESPVPSEADMQHAKAGLFHVWVGTRSKTTAATFGLLRL